MLLITFSHYTTEIMNMNEGQEQTTWSVYPSLCTLGILTGGGMWQHSWLRHYAARWKVTGSIPDQVMDLSIDLMLPAALWP
jgi:hypothetical protein